MINILVVDDEQDIEFLFRQRFRKEIQDQLIELYFAFSGEEALTILANRNRADIVLILSDINMPGMSGFELLRILKEKYSNLKIFMITAYSDDSNEQKSVELGADRFITKPIDFNMLKEEIFSGGI